MVRIGLTSPSALRTDRRAIYLAGTNHARNHVGGIFFLEMRSPIGGHIFANGLLPTGDEECESFVFHFGSKGTKPGVAPPVPCFFQSLRSKAKSKSTSMVCPLPNPRRILQANFAPNAIGNFYPVDALISQAAGY